MKRWWVMIATLVSLVIMVQEVVGSRILFISPIASKSQKGYFNALVNTLADNGHQVTIVSSYKPSKVRNNVREVVLQDVDVMKVLPNLFSGNRLSGPAAFVDAAPRLCSEALSRKEVQDLLKEEFDLGMISIFLSDCFLSMFHQLKIPYIYVCPAGLVGPMSTVMGNPVFPSFVNSPFIHVSHPFTFPQRLLNTIGDTIFDLVFRYIVPSNVEKECRSRGLCPEEMPSLVALRGNASLLLVNSVRSIESPPRPVVPSIVHCGGIHCKDSKPLPKDLEEWVAGAGSEGFIFFSLGSAVKPSSMPEEYRKLLVNVFDSLKQRVLWKWDLETMEDLPPNVRLGKWLPQQDILGDPRLRLFITHGGCLSTQESMYHGIQVLGLPVFADQMTNMMEVQRQGWGRVLNWEELNEKSFKDSIISVMTDEGLRAEVKRRSAVMRDIPQDQSQVINYWVEYVIRHKGAPHLKSPILSMPWYQVYNVDVWLTVLALLLGLFYLFLKLIQLMWRCCCGSKSKSKSKKD